MIAVIGATGNTGRAAVKELKALGENPLCIVRNADKAREVLGADAKTAVAEITDKPALEKALKGCDSVFMVTGHGPQVAEQQIGIIEAAKAAGVGYFVKVSGGKAVVKPDAESAVFRSHYAVEAALDEKRIEMDDPASRPVHAEHVYRGADDQKRQQDGDTVSEGYPALLHRRPRHRGARRARDARSRQACRQDL